MMLLDQPGSLGTLAAATATVLTTPSWPVVLGLIAAGFLLALMLIRLRPPSL